MDEFMRSQSQATNLGTTTGDMGTSSGGEYSSGPHSSSGLDGRESGGRDFLRDELNKLRKENIDLKEQLAGSG